MKWKVLFGVWGLGFRKKFSGLGFRISGQCLGIRVLTQYKVWASGF